jgi:hypothetical protein
MSCAPTPAEDEALALTELEANILRRCQRGASVQILFPDDCKRLAGRGLLHWHGGEGVPGYYEVTQVGADLVQKNSKKSN